MQFCLKESVQMKHIVHKGGVLPFRVTIFYQAGALLQTLRALLTLPLKQSSDLTFEPYHLSDNLYSAISGMLPGSRSSAG